ncbi:hypothetical protein ACGFX4_40155 [Kitasatospora sp. NPDC048365]|uniref:hypothetical protein n=1 Tax=Kitasatospora sp. NPDC048365 TaxID=3364050 RepID=UPI003714F8A1
MRSSGDSGSIEYLVAHAVRVFGGAADLPRRADGAARTECDRPAKLSDTTDRYLR